MPSTATAILDGLSTSTAVKAPVAATTSGNITLAGLQGYTEDDRILVWQQSTASENGIYGASSGSWTRTKDFDGNRDVRKGTLIPVEGSAILYRVTSSNPIIIGTSSISFEALGPTQTQGDIGLLLYPRTAAEIAAGWIPTNYAYQPGDCRRHGCVGDGTTDDTVAVQKTITLSAGYFNSTRTAAQRGIAAAYFPGGAYLCTDQITVPDGACIKGDNDAVFFFDDGGSGEYLFKNGADGVQGGYLHWAGKLYIVLKTVTAKGFWLMNSVSSRFDNIYVEGLVDGVLTSRTNVGFRLDTTAGIDSFHNEFPSMDFNHCHTGFCSPASGGTTTKQFFGYARCYGDRASGDTTSRGFDIEGCQDSSLESGYFESYGVGAGAAAFRLATSASVRWKVSNITFDDQAANMNCIVLAGAGTPQYNQFLGCTFGSNSLVVDGTTAVDGNFIENNPNIAATGTATLVPLTSGTITLTAGAGGNQYFCERRGRMVRVWGKLNVASVSSPVGRLTIGGLPFTVANNASNFAPALIRISDFNNTMESTVQGYAIPNSTTIEIERWVLGAVATDTAAQVKAGSVIVFDCTYAAA